MANGIAAATLATAGCGHSRAEDGGPTVQRSYQVGDFQRIEVAGPYDVDVRTGALQWREETLADNGRVPALTDGARVLLHHRVDGQDVLVAHDLRTGRAVWRTVLPDRTQRVVGLADGGVAVVGRGWVVGLG